MAAVQGGAGASVEHVPWPATNTLPKFLPGVMTKFRLTHPDAIGTRLAAGNFLLGTHVVMTEKLDGSNIGVDAHGEIMSRTQVVDHTAERFIRAPLSEVRQYTDCVAQVEKALLGDAKGHVVVFGELMCIKSKYPYDSDRDLKWFVFGARVTPYDAVLPQGVWAIRQRDDAYATLPLSPVLQGIFRECHLPTVPIIGDEGHDGSVADVICYHHDGMQADAERIEGYVLHTPHHILKWKTEKPALQDVDDVRRVVAARPNMVILPPNLGKLLREFDAMRGVEWTEVDSDADT
jgi:hypothetical protein